MAAVFIPDGCESIGDGAFINCANLTKIRIPNGCALGTNVFNNDKRILIYGTAGSAAETYCTAHDNCVFAVEAQD